MISRRTFIATAAAGGLGTAGALAWRASSTGRAEYEDAVRQTWRHGEGVPRNAPAALLELVRYATLAPSSARGWYGHSGSLANALPLAA